jgi:hypothetical protein
MSATAAGAFLRSERATFNAQPNLAFALNNALTNGLKKTISRVFFHGPVEGLVVLGLSRMRRQVAAWV